MEKLFQDKIKKYFGIVSIIICLLSSFIILLLPGNNHTPSIMTNLDLSNVIYDASPIVCLVLLLLFILTIPLDAFGILYLIKEKKEYKIFFSSLIGLNLLFLVLGNYQGIFNSSHITFIVINFIIYFSFAIYCIAKKIYLFKVNKEKMDHKIDLNKISIFILNILSFLSILLCFVLPFALIYSKDYVQESILITPLNAMTSSSYSIEDLVLLILLFGVSLISGGFLLSSFNAFDQDDFYQKSKRLMILNFSFTFAYFIGGIIYAFANVILFDVECHSFAYIPFIVTTIIIIIFFFLYGKNKGKENYPKVKKNLYIMRLESMIYALVFFGLTLGTLFLNILHVTFTKPLGIEDIYINGFDVLMNFKELGEGIQLISYVIFLCVVTSSLLFLVTLFSYASKSKIYSRVFLISIILDITYIALIGLFGKYYEIAQIINQEKLDMIITAYFGGHLPISLQFEYTVTSDSFYMLLGATAFLILVLIRVPYTKLTHMDEKDAIPVEIKKDLSNEELKDNEKTNEVKEDTNKENEKRKEEKTNKTFDACPAFSEIDSKLPLYQNELKKRKQKEFENLSLPSLISFIVNYAKESRLHLFYSYEDIAYFIAGLGSSRLSILQGMSGTGKTSLPKIVLEALMGNVEIIEIESSWRDKNELLGYYNEFSKTYSPRKFTQALYKATLNKEVPTFIILDEMNLSRIEYYFSDFLSLMENEEDHREIKLLNTKIYHEHDFKKESYLGLKEDHTIVVPKNVWFIGTANKDESTFEISDKVYDRAMTMNFNKRAKSQLYGDHPLDRKYVSYEALQNLFNEAQKKIDFNIEESKIVQEVEKILIPYNISFGNRIAKQMESFIKIYCSCFANPSDVLNDALEMILLNKVVFKLETKNIENKEFLKSEFERLKLYRIKEFIEKLNED